MLASRKDITKLPGRAASARFGACQLQYAVEWYGRQVLTRIEGDLRDTGGAIEKS